MSNMNRASAELVFTFPDGETDSVEIIRVERGAFGTILVPAGSDLIGKSLNFMAISSKSPAAFVPTALLGTAKELAAGANPLTTDEILAVGAVHTLRLSLDAAVDGDSALVLLWKS